MEALGREGEWWFIFLHVYTPVSRSSWRQPPMTRTRLTIFTPGNANPPGKKDGQVLMIKNNGQVEAYQVSRREPSVCHEPIPERYPSGPLYSQHGSPSFLLVPADSQWSTSASTWQQIGQVVDAIGSGRKQLYEGKEYDHVFDVDVAEGVPPLKLPYNLSGEWEAVSRFSTVIRHCIVQPGMVIRSVAL
jgi:hypothetical protein